MHVNLPRLVVAGLSGDSGKTTVSLSVVTALRDRGLTVSVFKKGPDFIDSAWLGAVARTTCRNLDTYLVDPVKVRNRFLAGASGSDITIIEGNRGIFDGKDISGTHSTSELARLLQAPILLVVNTTKMTRTIGAIVSGVIDFDREVTIAGVILNRVAGERHRKILTESIERFCNVPVLGCVPKLGDDASVIPGRHLGLVTPSEFGDSGVLHEKLSQIALHHIDIDGIVKLASAAGTIEMTKSNRKSAVRKDVRIGYFDDSVFTFYYPENLEALESEGAELVAISSLADKALPQIDALYIGGGFPETQAQCLCANDSMMKSVKNAAESGLPIYAECGGLIYLSRSLTWHGRRSEMAGVLPLDLKMHDKPVGHGYVRCRVDRDNPFYEIGAEIKGHEFHYSGAIADADSRIEACCAMERGVGVIDKRDGLVFKSVMAGYTHIHADGVPQWSRGIANAARRFRATKRRTNPSSESLSERTAESDPNNPTHDKFAKNVVNWSEIA